MSEKLLHTSGPWKVGIFRRDESVSPTVEEIKEFLSGSIDRTVQNGDSIDDLYLVLSSDNPEDPVYTAITGNGPTAEANAYLISAAPDLLAVCKLALEKLTGTGRGGTLGHHPDNPIPAKLRIAIAKAESTRAKGGT